MKFRNKDMIACGVIIIFLLVIYGWMKKNPASVIDRKPPLPINQYTSGAISNGMNVSSRVNFQQQPVGNNFS